MQSSPPARFLAGSGVNPPFGKRPPATIAGLALTLFILASLGLYVAVSVYAYRHPLEVSIWNARWAVATLVICAAIGALAIAGRSRLLLLLSLAAVTLVTAAVAILSHAVLDLVVLAWLLLIAVGAGDIVVAVFARDVALRPVERTVFSLVLGLCAIGFVTFALAALRLLTLPVAIAVFLLASAGIVAWWRTGPSRFLGRDLWRELRAMYDARPVLTALVVAGIALAYLGALPWAMAPEIRNDALVYQLSVPEAYVANHGLIELAGNFRSYWIGLANMNSTLALLFAGQPLPQLLVLGNALILCWQTLAFGRRLGGDAVGLIAAVLVAAVPYLIRLESSAMIDVPVAVLTFGALYAGLAWVEDGRLGWLTIFGLLAGSAFSAKMSAGVFLAPAAVAIGVLLLRRKRSVRTAALTFLGRAVVPAAVTGLPWLILRSVWTGNPVYPFLNEIFHSEEWRAASSRMDWDTFGVGSGLGAFLRLPWDMTVNSWAFSGSGDVPGAFSIICLLAIPAFLLVVGPEERRRWLPTALVALVGSGIWFLNVPYARYGLPLAPLLAALSAMNVTTALTWVRSRWANARIIAPAAIALAVLVLAATRIVTTSSVVREPERYPYSVALGQTSADEFLTRHLDYLPAARYLNAQSPDSYAVVSLGMPHSLYLRGSLTDALDYAGRLRHLLIIDDPEQLLAALQDYDYLLIDWATTERILTTDRGTPLDLGQRDPTSSDIPLILSHSRFLAPYLHEVFAANGISVFRIPPAGEPDQASPAIAAANAKGCDATAKSPKAGARGAGARSEEDACIVADPNPVIAGYGRGDTLVSWSAGGDPAGELRLAVDDQPETSLAQGAGGTYRLKRLAPGSTYVLRVYGGPPGDQHVLAEQELHVWMQ
jgi:4-amino-4-deoxy-L-arabinose transferase-like glycosyltransferase